MTVAIKDTDRKARANYKKKITTLRVELYGTDEDIREHVEKIKEDGQSVQGYIKDLIRKDMGQEAKLVRCKDCKHYDHSVYTETGFFCGLHSEGETYVVIGPDDFCSYGEKKTK